MSCKEFAEDSEMISDSARITCP